MSSREAVSLGKDWLVMTLERLLELPTTDVNSILSWAAQLVTEALAAENVSIYFYDAATDSLVALDTSNTSLERTQHACCTDRLLLANDGRLVEVFLTGIPYLAGYANQDSSQELAGVKDRLSAKSEMVTVFEVETQPRGVILVSSCTPDFFSEHDLRLLQAMARWIGIVIHRAELVERTRREAIEQEQHLAAEDLLTIMAHDLRNYLTPLNARLERIKRRVRSEEREQDGYDITLACNTLHLLEQVVEDVLDVARLNHGIFVIHPHFIDLVKLVQETAPVFSAPETPIYVHAPHKVMLLVDADRLRQLLQNPLANAVKYAPKHTPITVHVGTERRKNGPWALLIVSNAGLGIPPGLRTQFARPFVTAATPMGLGLGLYLSNKIAAAHYGSLTVDSPRGQGVQVTLALPIEDRDPNEYLHEKSNLVR